MFGDPMIFYTQVARIPVAEKLSYVSVDRIAFLKIVSTSYLSKNMER